MMGAVWSAVTARARLALREHLDAFVVSYVVNRQTLPRNLGELLLEKLAQRYGARVEMFEGPG